MADCGSFQGLAATDPDERSEKLRQAMAGIKLLLVLDDLWCAALANAARTPRCFCRAVLDSCSLPLATEAPLPAAGREEEHESQLSFLDEAAGGKVLISSRVRGLLTGATVVDIGLPSEDEAIGMLLAAAGADAAAAVPAEARSVVRLCKCLPLSLSMAGKLVEEIGLDKDWRGILEVLEVCYPALPQDTGQGQTCCTSASHYSPARPPLPTRLAPRTFSIRRSSSKVQIGAWRRA